MRTTVNIPEGLLTRLKVRAAETGRTLSDLMVDAARGLLDRRGDGPEGGPGWRPSRALEPRPGIDLTSNAGLWDILDQEDGRVVRS